MDAILQVKNLTKFFGKRKVLDNISFDAYRGEVLGFLGPNGAGKTTTIKIIMGFLGDDGGEILIDGKNLKSNYEKCMAMLGGIVENPELYKELSGRVNLEMYARLHDGVTKERIEEVISLVGMESRIDEKVKRYSLGMKQRVGLAQALLHRPQILIMDEPTNGLDPAGIKELRDIFKMLAHQENIAVIVSSHMLTEMEQMCDRVAVIDRGVILNQKPIGEFIQQISGADVYRFFVDRPADAAAGLKDLGTACEITVGETWFDICCSSDSVPEVNRFLVHHDIAVYGISKISHTLEDAFISLVGGGNHIA